VKQIRAIWLGCLGEAFAPIEEPGTVSPLRIQFGAPGFFGTRPPAVEQHQKFKLHRSRWGVSSRLSPFGEGTGPGREAWTIGESRGAAVGTAAGSWVSVQRRGCWDKLGHCRAGKRGGPWSGRIERDWAPSPAPLVLIPAWGKGRSRTCPVIPALVTHSRRGQAMIHGQVRATGRGHLDESPARMRRDLAGPNGLLSKAISHVQRFSRFKLRMCCVRKRFVPA